MIKIKIIILLSLFLTTSIFAQDKAQDKEEKEPPPGMKIIRIGNFNRLIPEDMEIHTDEKGLITYEGTQEYIARKVKELAERVSAVEKENESLKEEINTLKEKMDKP